MFLSAPSLLWQLLLPLSHSLLRAILWESEAKLEMKNYKPPPLPVRRQATRGDEQKQPYLDRQVIVAMATAPDHVGQTSMFLPKNQEYITRKAANKP